MKRFLLSLVLLATFSQTSAEFAFGIYPEANSINNQVQLEKKYGFRSPIVGFIFDTFEESDAWYLKNAVKTFGTDRVYHVGISPFGLSAAEVASGAYDTQYNRFFQVVKETKAKFLFRTMHEMNGSWFSWSGDPDAFKRAWVHVYELSRKAGLDNSNILFIFSVNSEDLPAAEEGVIGGEMTFCTPKLHLETGCKVLEDYYPGDQYVDMMGLSLYNWGRGRPEPWASWKNFYTLFDNRSSDIYSRLQAYRKPIFLDEVGTTAVDFKGSWTFDKVVQAYDDDFGRKDYWIAQMREEIKKFPEIVGAMYFNRDKTRGFTIGKTIPGELDWAALSTITRKEYPAILRFFQDPDVTLLTLPFAGNAPKLQAEILFKKLVKEVERRSYGSIVNQKKLFARVADNLANKANMSTGNKKIVLQSIVDKCKEALK
ncbi:MAG: glycosyl hydrolase [Candidatus Gracilibacteria bacterium]|nr:glycosyl hydrolase [Candidatus Gracilibacteria bacterium]